MAKKDRYKGKGQYKEKPDTNTLELRNIDPPETDLQDPDGMSTDYWDALERDLRSGYGEPLPYNVMYRPESAPFPVKSTASERPYPLIKVKTHDVDKEDSNENADEDTIRDFIDWQGVNASISPETVGKLDSSFIVPIIGRGKSNLFGISDIDVINYPDPQKSRVGTTREFMESTRLPTYNIGAQQVEIHPGFSRADVYNNATYNAEEWSQHGNRMFGDVGRIGGGLLGGTVGYLKGLQQQNVAEGQRRADIERFNAGNYQQRQFGAVQSGQQIVPQNVSTANFTRMARRGMGRANQYAPVEIEKNELVFDDYNLVDHAIGGKTHEEYNPQSPTGTGEVRVVKEGDTIIPKDKFAEVYGMLDAFGKVKAERKAEFDQVVNQLPEDVEPKAKYQTGSPSIQPMQTRNPFATPDMNQILYGSNPQTGMVTPPPSQHSVTNAPLSTYSTPQTAAGPAMNLTQQTPQAGNPYNVANQPLPQGATNSPNAPYNTPMQATPQNLNQGANPEFLTLPPEPEKESLKDRVKKAMGKNSDPYNLEDKIYRSLVDAWSIGIGGQSDPIEADQFYANDYAMYQQGTQRVNVPKYGSGTKKVSKDMFPAGVLDADLEVVDSAPDYDEFAATVGKRFDRVGAATDMYRHLYGIGPNDWKGDIAGWQKKYNLDVDTGSIKTGTKFNGNPTWQDWANFMANDYNPLATGWRQGTAVNYLTPTITTIGGTPGSANTKVIPTVQTKEVEKAVIKHVPTSITSNNPISGFNTNSGATSGGVAFGGFGNISLGDDISISDPGQNVNITQNTNNNVNQNVGGSGGGGVGAITKGLDDDFEKQLDDIKQRNAKTIADAKTVNDAAQTELDNLVKNNGDPQAIQAAQAKYDAAKQQMQAANQQARQDLEQQLQKGGVQPGSYDYNNVLADFDKQVGAATANMPQSPTGGLTGVSDVQAAINQANQGTTAPQVSSEEGITVPPGGATATPQGANNVSSGMNFSTNVSPGATLGGGAAPQQPDPNDVTNPSNYQSDGSGNFVGPNGRTLTGKEYNKMTNKYAKRNPYGGSGTIGKKSGNTTTGNVTGASVGNSNSNSTTTAIDNKQLHINLDKSVDNSSTIGKQKIKYGRVPKGGQQEIITQPDGTTIVRQSGTTPQASTRQQRTPVSGGFEPMEVPPVDLSFRKRITEAPMLSSPEQYNAARVDLEEKNFDPTLHNQQRADAIQAQRATLGAATGGAGIASIAGAIGDNRLNQIEAQKAAQQQAVSDSNVATRNQESMMNLQLSEQNVARNAASRARAEDTNRGAIERYQERRVRDENQGKADAIAQQQLALQQMKINAELEGNQMYRDMLTKTFPTVRRGARNVGSLIKIPAIYG